MKPVAALRRQLAFLAVAAAVVTALTVQVVTLNDSDVENDRQVRNQLRDLARLDAKLDTDILRARDGLDPNYDALVETQRSLRTVLMDLESGGLASLRARNPSIDESLTSLDVEFENGPKNNNRGKTGEVLDELKMRHAIVANSSRYFPIALSLVDSPEPGVISARHHLESVMLAFTLAPDDNREGLERLLAEKSPTDPALRNALKHARKISEVAASLDADMNALRKDDTAAMIKVLTEAYDTTRASSYSRANWLRGALTVTSIALLASFAFVLRQIYRTNASAQRFVPHELLRALGRSSLAEVKRGDAAALEMHILFADIRDFTKRMEAFTPADAFAFMNDYLAAMGAPISANRGFITEYRGDGIVALFPGIADDAMNAALGMLAALDTLNAGRAKPVEIGIGVHSGHVWLGTFGATDRMNAGVVSAAVVMASRIEGLTKHYKVPLLITEATRLKLTPHAFKLRRVDNVQPVGASEATLVYDAPHGDNVDALVGKYDEALESYWEGRYADAREAFEQLGGDPVARALAQRCSRYQMTPPSRKRVYEPGEK